MHLRSIHGNHYLPHGVHDSGSKATVCTSRYRLSAVTDSLETRLMLPSLSQPLHIVLYILSFFEYVVNTFSYISQISYKYTIYGEILQLFWLYWQFVHLKLKTIQPLHWMIIHPRALFFHSLELRSYQ